jgi:hypothetical protein
MTANRVPHEDDARTVKRLRVQSSSRHSGIHLDLAWADVSSATRARAYLFCYLHFALEPVVQPQLRELITRELNDAFGIRLCERP